MQKKKNITLKLRNKSSRKLKAMTQSSYSIPARLTLYLFIPFILYSCSDNDQLFDGGNGTEANPYQISTFEELREIAEEENLDKHFIQVADIDAADFSENGEEGTLKPIGSRETPFTGTYNGNGYQITNLSYYEFEKYMGLFGYIQEAEIKNVTLAQTIQDKNEKITEGYAVLGQEQSADANGIDIDSDNFKVGGSLVGFNDGGVIQNCRSYSFFNSRRHDTGGLVGYNGGEIYNSYAAENVTGNSLSGGLVSVNSGLIQNSYSIGDVTSPGMAGGLVGYNYGGQIIDSFAKGSVSSQSTNGGLAAINTGQIQASFAHGNTAASQFGYTGGLVGQNEGEIRDSYSLGDVTYQETSGAGSLTGINKSSGVIMNSFASAPLFSFPEVVDAVKGGVTAINEGTISASYWDTETTGQSSIVGEGNPEGATGLTTTQMTGPEAEQNMPEFDWMNVWRTTEGYPVLRWQDDE